MFIVGQLGATVDADQKPFDRTLDSVYQTGAKRMQDLGKKMTTYLTAPLTAMAGMSVKAFDTQIQAEKRLESALRSTGEEVENNMASFREFAKGLQDITTVGDESTLKMLQVAKSMGLTNDQAKRAARNSIALAKAMGMNEQSAIRYAAALEQGQVTMLSRYLPGLRDIEDMSERAAKAQELLANMFDAATTEAQVGLGPLTQIKNTLGDFSEEIGEIVLQRMQPLISNLRDTVNWFGRLDQDAKEMIVTVGGLAAALGPATFGLGWAIRLTIPAVTTLTSLVKGLTAAMLANPFYAVAAAVAYVGTRAVIARQSLNALKGSIQGVIDQGNDLDAVNKKIAEIGEKFKEAARVADTIPGVEAEDIVDPELVKQLDQLVALQRQLASEQSGLGIDINDVNQMAQFMDFINSDFSELSDTASGMELETPFVEAQEPMNKVISNMRELDSLVYSVDVSVPDKYFPPGSLGALRQQLQGLRESLSVATNPEDIRQLQLAIAETNNEIQNFGDSAVSSGRNAAMAMGSLGNSIGGVIGQLVRGKKEALSFGNILASVAPALLNVLTGGSGGFVSSIASGLFGGFRANGGPAFAGQSYMVGESGPEMFVPSTNGSVQPIGSGKMSGGITKQEMSQVFGQYLQRLGPEEIFAMSKRGQFSY